MPHPHSKSHPLTLALNPHCLSFAAMAKHTFPTLLFSLAIIFLSCPPQPLASSSPFNHAPRFPASTKPSRAQAQAQAQSQSQPQQYRYETRYFQQRLDHFSFSELPTFSQRYLINTEHWVGPQRLGPIFFYCGNEGDIEWFAQNTGFVWEIAPQFGAMVVFPEVIICPLCSFSFFFFFFLFFTVLVEKIVECVCVCVAAPLLW